MRALVLAAALAMVGCGGGGSVTADGGTDARQSDDGGIDATPTDGGGARVVIGSAPGDGAGFIAVDDGTDVELIPGAQGGFHVWISARTTDLVGKYYFRVSARRVADDALVLAGGLRYVDIPETASGASWETESASPAFMCPVPIGISIRDMPIRFTLEVFTYEDDPDRKLIASDTLVLVPHCPETDQQEFCINICSG